MENVSLRSGVVRDLITGSGDATGDWKYKDAPTMAVQIIVASADGVTATATATQAGGVINAVNLVQGGAFYTAAPTVSVSGATAGSGANITANISGGKVISFNIVSGGTGYDSPITVTIAGPNLAVAATVDIQQSNDGVAPAVTSTTLTPSGTRVTSLGAVVTGPWKYVRAKVSGSTGNGVNTSVQASV